MILRQSTAKTILVGPILDSAGAAKTDEVVASIKVTKNGTVGAANGSATLTHDHAGKYKLALTATDCDTVGLLEISLNSGTNDMPIARLCVVEEAVYDSMFAASAAGYQVPIWASSSSTVNLSATTVKTLTDAVALPSSATIAITGNITGNVSGSVGSVTGNVGGNVSGSVASVVGLTASNLDAAISSRMATYTQPTGFLAATFPATVASTTNITAATGIVLANSAQTVTSFTATAGMTITNSTTNGNGLSITGNGTGHGVLFTSGGATSDAMRLSGGNTTGNGLYALGGSSGVGIRAYGNYGMRLDAVDGAALLCDGNSASGIIVASDDNVGISITGIGSGVSIPQGITSNITGTITTTTNLTNLPAITANWLTAAGLAADAVTEIQSGLMTSAGYTAPPSAATIADAVWDEAQSGHVTVGTFGYYLDSQVSAAGGGSLTAADVWSYATRVLTAGTNIALAKGVGVTGFTDIDAAGIRTATGLASANLDTQLSAIVADTNELQTDWANGGRLDLILDARASQTSVDDLPTNAELTTALGTADDATLAAIAALNNITAASVVAAMGTGTFLTAIPWNAAWDAEVQSECTDALNAYDPPTNAEMEARTLAAANYFDPAVDTVANVTLVGTLTTYTGNTPQTGDAYAVVNSGTYGNAALKTLIDTLETVVDAILTDTGTDGVALSAAICNKIADHVRRRTQANVEASSDGDTLSVGSLYGAIQQSQESAISGTTQTIKKTDGTTTLGTKTVSKTTGDDPIRGIS